MADTRADPNDPGKPIAWCGRWRLVDNGDGRAYWMRKYLSVEGVRYLASPPLEWQPLTSGPLSASTTREEPCG